MNNSTPGTQFSEILKEGNPKAVAWINGNANNPQLSGVVKFYVTPYEGVLIEAEVLARQESIIPKFRRRIHSIVEIWCHYWVIRDMCGFLFMTNAFR